MKIKYLITSILMIPVFILFLGFTYYLSIDVEILKSSFPTISKSGDQFEVDFIDQRPKSWSNLNEISKFGKWTIVLSEDWSFYDHKGFDFNQILQTLKDSLKERKLTRGASTISQQLVKNLFVGRERSIKRKIKELIVTIKLERSLSKEQILETYLNVIEFGPNVFGIKQASQFYFKKNPNTLTAREGAFLATLLPNPVIYMTSYNRQKTTRFMSRSIDSILIKLRQAKVINEKIRYRQSLIPLIWEK